MQLSGYRRACGKRNGGIRSLALVQAEAVAEAEYDVDAGCWARLTLSQGKEFAEYHFKEDEAVFTETVTANAAGVLVTHTLSFVLERMDTASARAVRELCTSTPNGLVAIVTTNNDVSVVVGYSRKFGAGYPLRVQRAAAASGRKLADTSAETVVLVSVDIDKAIPFVGGSAASRRGEPYFFIRQGARAFVRWPLRPAATPGGGARYISFRVSLRWLPAEN